jgi:hypothetical protein
MIYCQSSKIHKLKTNTHFFSMRECVVIECEEKRLCVSVYIREK